MLWVEYRWMSSSIFCYHNWGRNAIAGTQNHSVIVAYYWRILEKLDNGTNPQIKELGGPNGPHSWRTRKQFEHWGDWILVSWMEAALELVNHASVRTPWWLAVGRIWRREICISCSHVVTFCPKSDWQRMVKRAPLATFLESILSSATCVLGRLISFSWKKY